MLAAAVGWRRVRGQRGVDGPVCGGCGYGLAPNPEGLTVCPECGGDFLSVGILGPRMRLGRRGSPVVPLGVAWFVLVAVGMVPLHGVLVREFTRQVAMVRGTRFTTGTGALRGVKVATYREQVSGEKAPEVLTADVKITGPDGKEAVLTVEGLTGRVVKGPAGTDLVGSVWDGPAAKRAAQAAGAEVLDEDAVERVRLVVSEALDSPSAGGGVVSSSSSSSSWGAMGRRSEELRKKGAYVQSGSGSSFSGGSMPVVMVGGLRGAHWVTLLVCVGGVLLAVVGVWLIALVTRERGVRGGGAGGVGGSFGGAVGGGFSR